MTKGTFGDAVKNAVIRDSLWAHDPSSVPHRYAPSFFSIAVEHAMHPGSCTLQQPFWSQLHTQMGGHQ